MRRRDVLAVVSMAASAGCLGTTNAGVSALTGGGSDDQCPTFDDGADATVCPGRDPNVPVSFDRTKSRLPDDGDGEVGTLTFTLRNHSNRPFSVNPNDWRIRAWTTEGWRRVAPDVIFQPLYEVPAGGAYRWELGLRPRSDSGDPRTHRISEALDPGRYAFAVSGNLGNTRVECVARFRIGVE